MVSAGCLIKRPVPFRCWQFRFEVFKSSSTLHATHTPKTQQSKPIRPRSQTSVIQPAEQGNHWTKKKFPFGRGVLHCGTRRV